MGIIKQEDWNKQVETNKDAYGKCCVDVARKVMEILDEEGGTFDASDLICRADKEIDAGGITGFMAGAIASMVSHCHSRGDEFKKSWNAPYQKPDEKEIEGVINPAIVTIDTSKIGQQDTP